MKKVFKQIKIFETSFKEKNCSMNCKELKTVHKVDCQKVIKDSAEQLKNQINSLQVEAIFERFVSEVRKSLKKLTKVGFDFILN